MEFRHLQYHGGCRVKECAERLIQILKGANLRGKSFILDYNRGPKSAQQDGQA